MSLASRCFSGQLRILGRWEGRGGKRVFPVEISSIFCRRAGNSAQGLEQGLYPVMWSQAGAWLSLCTPPMQPCWGVDGFAWHHQSRLWQMPGARRTCSRVVVPRGWQGSDWVHAANWEPFAPGGWVCFVARVGGQHSRDGGPAQRRALGPFPVYGSSNVRVP